MNGPQFEEEVRRVARALWEADPGQGGAELVDGRERDCIFEQEHVTHYIECTTLRTMEKVERDARKMYAYREKRERTGRLVKLWFITRDEPTAHQRQVCEATRERKGIEILSLKEFRRRVIDGTTYLELRGKSAFGSARDPNGDDSQDVSRVRYQPTALRVKGTDRSMTVADVIDALLQNKVVVLLGDYGMGKSLTVREIYQGLRRRYLLDNDGQVPVAVNLREYWGLARSSEILTRHAENVGLTTGVQLVRGFNAGRLIVLLDGFDETAAIPWASRNIQRLKDVRRKALEVVRAFSDAARGRSGLLISGREGFFDSFTEMTSALGVRETDIILELSEFSEDEATSFLKSANVPTALPDWLPRRPLLLASFVAKKLLDVVLAQRAEAEPARAWNAMIKATCEREERIHEFLDASAIRNILEDLAGRSRETPTGLGPITESDLADAFRTETGAQPDNTAWPLLLRLPGLTSRDAQPGTRHFIDDQMLSALRAGQVARYGTNPRQKFEAFEWKHGLDELGVLSVAVQLTGPISKSPSALIAAAKSAIRSKCGTLAFDLMQTARAIAEDDSVVDFGGLEIGDAYSPCFDLSVFAVPRNLTIRESSIGRFTCVSITSPSFSFVNCLIENLEGVSRRDLLPPYIEGSCDIGEFDAFATNASVLKDDTLVLPIRVLLTILRKLYLQGGAGRKENAFFRGMGNDASRYVPELLGIIKREGLAIVTAGPNPVWHPLRASRTRAYRLLETSTSSSDLVVIQAQGLVRP